MKKKKSRQGFIQEKEEKKGLIKIVAFRIYEALIKKELFQNWPFYIIVFLAIPTLFFLMKAELSYPDGLGYFIYTRSLLLDHNLSFLNELKSLSINPEANKYFHYTQNGYISSPFAIGTPILWIPFFLFAHILILFCNFFKTGYIIPTDGNSYLYLFSVSLGSCIYGILSLFLSLKLCLRLFLIKDSFLSLLAIWLSSPFVFCFYYMPNYSHLADSFAISLFLLMWVSSKDKNGLVWWFIYGISFGLLVLVRWQNLLLGILLLIPLRIHKLFIQHILFGIGSFVVFLPQLIAWKIIYGKFFLIPQGEGFMRWTNPEILKFLFSSWHGLYSWTPILFFSTIGLFLLYKIDKRLFIGFLLIILIQLYVNSCVADWWAGISFGARRLTGLTPIFILGLACFLCFLRKGIIRYFLVSICFFWSFTLILSMLSSPDYLGEYHSYSELIKIQLHSLLNLKESALKLLDFSPLEKIKEFKAYNLSSTIKTIYCIFGCLFFLFLKIAYIKIFRQKRGISEV
ncbi:MAG: hypothetical protein AB1630_06340 [bacterium]